MRKIGLALALLSFIGGCIPGRSRLKGPGHDADWPIEDPGAPAYALYLEAQNHSNNGEVDEAIAAYEEFLKLKPDSAKAHLGLASELARKGDLARAEQTALKATELDPKLRDAFFLLGKIHSARQNWDQSEAALRKSIELDPEREEDGIIALASVFVESKRLEKAAQILETYTEQNPNSLFGLYYLGRVYSEMGRTDEALRTYEKSLTVNPGFLSSLKAIALIYEYQGKKDEAVRTFEQILESEPGNAGIRNHLAQLYLERKETEKARKELEILAEEQPDNLSARLRLGLLYLQMDRLKEAEAALRKLRSDAPQKDRVDYYLGVVLEKRGDGNGARKHFESVPENSDLYIDARLALSFVLEREGDLKGSEANLRAALAKFPNASQVIAALASTLVHQKRGEEARDLLEKAIGKSPKDETLWFSRGEIHDALKNFPEMEKSMRKVLELNPDSANALNYLGYSYAEKGNNLDEAEKLVRRALEIRPKDGYITDSLGWVCFKKKQTEKALELLEEANKLAPNETVILEHLGDVLVEMKKPVRAREFYEKALKASKDEQEKQKLREKLKKPPRAR